MRGAPHPAALALALAATPLPCYAVSGNVAAIPPAPLPTPARYEIGPEVDPLQRMTSLRHPTKGPLGDFRGDPLDKLDPGQRWSWKRLEADLDPHSNLVLSSASRTLLERSAKAHGPEILPALLKVCQAELLRKARGTLATRRLRVRRLRSLERQRDELAREARREAARARRRGRNPRDDGRVRRARARLRDLDDLRSVILGRLPEAELTLTRLAAYRDHLVTLVTRKVRDLHSGAEQILRRLR